MGLKVRYISMNGYFDGLTTDRVYEVTEETETQYIIKPNDLGGKSSISKVKFEIVVEPEVPVMQLPDGTRVHECFHLISAGLNGVLRATTRTIFLYKIDSAEGYHGTCPTCGTKYFSLQENSSNEES